MANMDLRVMLLLSLLGNITARQSLVQIVLGREILKNLHKEDALAAVDLKWSVPQGSCVRPLLFTIYTQDLFSKCECSLNILRPKVMPYHASASYIGYLFATVLNTKYYRDQQNFCMAKAWLHGCVVTQLEKERKIGN